MSQHRTPRKEGKGNGKNRGHPSGTNTTDSSPQDNVKKVKVSQNQPNTQVGDPTDLGGKEMKQVKLITQVVQAMMSNWNPPNTGSSSSQDNSGGLYGEERLPTVLAAFPALAGNTATKYHDWVRRCELVFQMHSLTPLITMDPETSFNLAVDQDTNGRSPELILGLWTRLHAKAYVALRAAVEQTLGRDIASTITAEQAVVGECIMKVEQVEGQERLTLKNVDKFLLNNANYYWEKIKTRCRFTVGERLALSRQICNLKYEMGTDPQPLKNKYLRLVEECSKAGLIVTPEFASTYWLMALPPELDALNQALSTWAEVTWEQVFDAINSDYQKRVSTKQLNVVTERAMVASSAVNTSRPKHTHKKSVYCNHCKRSGHEERTCFIKNPKLRPSNHRPRSQPGPKHTDKSAGSNSFEFSATIAESPEIEDLIQDLADLSTANTGEEQCMASTEQDPPVYFVFDSAATSHITPNKRLLDKIRSVPEVSLTTAIKGSHTSIRERGVIALNKNWRLSEVAYIPNGAANLISEGRLCDAGYTIYKDKLKINVMKDEQIILRGFRYNKLWIYSTNGKSPTTIALNTLSRRTTRPRTNQESKEEEKTEVNDPGENLTQPPSLPPTSSSSSSSNSNYGRVNNHVTVRRIPQAYAPTTPLSSQSRSATHSE